MHWYRVSERERFILARRVDIYTRIFAVGVTAKCKFVGADLERAVVKSESHRPADIRTAIKIAKGVHVDVNGALAPVVLVTRR